MPRENTTVPLSTCLVIGQTGSNIHWLYSYTLNRPNIFPISFNVTVPWVSSMHAEISGVREAGTFQEFITTNKVTIAAIPAIIFISLYGVNKHCPVPSTSTDVATSVKTSLCIIAVGGVGGESERGKKRPSWSTIITETTSTQTALNR